MINLIADFIDQPLESDQVDQIVKQSSFESMKADLVNREADQTCTDNHVNNFMRKGIIGDWRNHFSDEQSMLFDELYLDRLRNIGLDMAYSHEEAKQKMIENGNGRILQQFMNK